MADNYLEKKMQDHARAAVRPRATNTHRAVVSIPFPRRTVVAASYADMPTETFRLAVRALAEAGCHVALLMPAATEAAGRSAAAETGARFLPFEPQKALEYIVSLWGQPHVLIIDSGEYNLLLPPIFAKCCQSPARMVRIGLQPLPPLPEAPYSNAIAPAHGAPGQAAMLLCLPAATFSGTVLRP